MVWIEFHTSGIVSNKQAKKYSANQYFTQLKSPSSYQRSYEYTKLTQHYDWNLWVFPV